MTASISVAEETGGHVSQVHQARRRRPAVHERHRIDDEPISAGVLFRHGAEDRSPIAEVTDEDDIDGRGVATGSDHRRGGGPRRIDAVEIQVEGWAKRDAGI